MDADLQSSYEPAWMRIGKAYGVAAYRQAYDSLQEDTRIKTFLDLPRRSHERDFDVLERMVTITVLFDRLVDPAPPEGQVQHEALLSEAIQNHDALNAGEKETREAVEAVNEHATRLKASECVPDL